MRPAPVLRSKKGTELLIALPIENSGDRTAFDVKLFDIDLRSGHLTSPVHFPLDLGAIAPGANSIVQLRFKVPGLNSSLTYELTVDGRYRDGDEWRHDGDDRRGASNRDRHDRDRDDVFHLATSIEIPPAAPGSTASSPRSPPSFRYQSADRNDGHRRCAGGEGRRPGSVGPVGVTYFTSGLCTRACPA
jgi:hypothetical protein